MSNYSKTTNFAVKDALLAGDPLKVIKGTDHDTEYNNIATAVATKTDNAAAAIVGGSINATPIGNSTSSTGGFSSVTTPLVDSGTTGSLSLKTNNGTTQLSLSNAGAHILNTSRTSSTNATALTITDTANGAQTVGTGARIAWSSNVGAMMGILGFEVGGSGASNESQFSFYASGTNSTPAQQFQVLGTNSATRNITVIGSNGGNPTLSTTAGSLAITPSVVIAGASLQIGTNPASSGVIGLPYGTFVSWRNSTNTGNSAAISVSTTSDGADVIQISTTQSAGQGGVSINGRTQAGAPTTASIAPSALMAWKNTSDGTVKIYYNDAGTLKSVTLV